MIELMNTTHEQAVQDLQKQIKEYYGRKVPFRVYHGSTNSTRVMSFKRSEMVDISSLNHVLKVDTEAMVVIAEPNVPMDKLINATLPHGVVPPVITEFPGITVGGAFQGGAIESGSFRWGAFSQTVNSIEMILGNGERITASPTQNADLFYGSAGSYGSLGLITSVEIKLVPAKKYVTITHIPVSNFAESLAVTQQYFDSDYDFIESGMFKRDGGSVIIGKFSDKAEGKILRFSRAHDPWYYQYVEKNGLARNTVTNSVPIKDYLFRFDRGAFWAAQLAFTQSGIPFNPLTRFLLNPLLKTRKLYQAVQSSAAGQRYLCQDIVVPAKSLVPFMEHMDKHYNMYPTGFCAVKTEPRSPLLFNGMKDTDMVYNIGVYGLRVEPYDKFIAVNRDIEQVTHKLGGRKWFYAHSYYTEKEFWDIYDKKWYDKLRQKYHATTLPDIYSRVRVRERYPVQARKAALKTALGRAKLRITD
ncbi:MAG TPA: FAD-binding oxidoreductase [Candidatus Saccharimonadales bacterium]|nr:FAD-binding oxidoreductase [Candidatus Saccharimonadales bacterium]